jgi:hypothetical protein
MLTCSGLLSSSWGRIHRSISLKKRLEKIRKETIVSSRKGKYTMMVSCKDPLSIFEPLIRVADPHPDLCPAFHFNVALIRIRLFISADPDPDPEPAHHQTPQRLHLEPLRLHC